MLERIQKGSSTYAVYEVAEGYGKIDHVSKNMINNNQDEMIGLAPVHAEMINGVTGKIYFDITGSITLSEYLSMRISQSNFKKTLVNIIDAVENLDEYMIDIHQILLAPDKVYINPIDNSIKFLCIVLEDYRYDNDLFLFFRNIVETSHVETVVNINEKDYFHIAWNITRNNNGFSLKNMKMVLLNGVNENTDISGQNTNAPVRNDLTQEKINETQVKYNEPSLMTVSAPPIPTPQESYQSVMRQSAPPFAPPSAPQPFVLGKHEEKKKGLFGRLFSSKNDNSAASPSPLSNLRQGGLSAIKNASAAASINDDESDITLQLPRGQITDASQLNKTTFDNHSYVSVAENPSSPEGSNGNANKMGAVIGDHFAGTTVLSSMSFPGGYAPDNENSVTTGGFTNSAVSSVQFQQPTPTPQVHDSVDRSGSFPRQPSVPSAGYSEVQSSVPAHNFSVDISKSKSSAPEPVNYGETTVLDVGMSGETTVLSSSQLESQFSAYLIRIKYNEKVAVAGPVFRIGKERSAVNYFISDNTAISRNHASIVIKDRRYYVIDHNSTNHTYINGQLIPSNVEVEVFNRTKIRLANEEFELFIS